MGLGDPRKEEQSAQQNSGGRSETSGASNPGNVYSPEDTTVLINSFIEKFSVQNRKLEELESNIKQTSEDLMVKLNTQHKGIKTLTSNINKTSSDLKTAEKKSAEMERNLNDKLVVAERKSIEIIGIISSIIGLGLGFVSVAKDQKDVFTTAITLLLTTCAFAIFATLMHYYFGGKELQKDAKSIMRWSVIAAIVLLFIVIMGQRRLELILFKSFAITNPPTQLILFKNLFTINKTIAPATD